MTGRWANDLELRKTLKGTPVCSVNLAVNEGYGENKTVQYIDVILWGKIAENACTFTKKGHLVEVVGKLQTRYRDIEGKKVKITEVIADEVGFLERKQDYSFPNNNNTENNYRDDDLPY